MAKITFIVSQLTIWWKRFAIKIELGDKF